MERLTIDAKDVLKQSPSIRVGFDNFTKALETYITNTESDLANVLHLLPDRVAGKVHVDVKKLLTLTSLFRDKESFLNIYASDKVGILIENESHYVYLPHSDSI